MSDLKSGIMRTAGNSARARFEALRPITTVLIAVSRYRRDRLQRELGRRDLAGALLYNSVNIRYATGSRSRANIASS